MEEQRQRDRTLFDFKSGRLKLSCGRESGQFHVRIRQGCNILIATDVAQRGLDIKDVAFVVNYARGLGGLALELWVFECLFLDA